MNYVQAVSMVRGKTNRDRRKIGNNTYGEILHDGTVAIILHSTPVVQIHPDGTYTLKTGGWQTVTTKDRINQYAPGRVYQEKGQWYYRNSNNTYPFMEGMVVQ